MVSYNIFGGVSCGSGPRPWYQRDAGSPGFKPNHSCGEAMPNQDPHPSCLKCLGQAHVSDKCGICKGFKPWPKKDRATTLKYLLLELALPPPSEPSASLWLLRVTGRSVLPVLNKRHWKLDSVPGLSKDAKRGGCSRESPLQSTPLSGGFVDS